MHLTNGAKNKRKNDVCVCVSVETWLDVWIVLYFLISFLADAIVLTVPRYECRQNEQWNVTADKSYAVHSNGRTRKLCWLTWIGLSTYSNVFRTDFWLVDADSGKFEQYRSSFSNFINGRVARHLKSEKWAKIEINRLIFTSPAILVGGVKKIPLERPVVDYRWICVNLFVRFEQRSVNAVRTFAYQFIGHT